MGAMNGWSLAIEEVELSRDAWEMAAHSREMAIRQECEARIRYDRAKSELDRYMRADLPPAFVCDQCGQEKPLTGRACKVHGETWCHECVEAADAEADVRDREATMNYFHDVCGGLGR